MKGTLLLIKPRQQVQTGSVTGTIGCTVTLPRFFMQLNPMANSVFIFLDKLAVSDTIDHRVSSLVFLDATFTDCSFFVYFTLNNNITMEA